MTASKILKIAAQEIGETEKPVNEVKYNTEYYGRKVNGSAYSWCACFVWWVFKEAGASALYFGGGKTASCTTLMNFYKAQGQIVTDGNYKAGDIVFYQFNKDDRADHVGIIESVSGNTITAIEGNTSVTSDDNGGAVMQRTRSKSLIMAVARPKYEENRMAVYTKENGIHIIEIPVEYFAIVMTDKKKKSVSYESYANAGFFGGYKENGTYFTLPTSHVVADFKAANQYTRSYCEARGSLSNGKLRYETYPTDKQFYGLKQSTLLIKNDTAVIREVATIGEGYDYAIAGVPIMRNGGDVIFKTFVTAQGWDASTLYATWHIFIGLKQPNADKIYVMAMKTSSRNMITSAEAFKKFYSLGFCDVIKLDGGGSAILKNKGKNLVCTLENRQINTILAWNAENQAVNASNPYAEPTTTLKKGAKGDGVKWLQWQLNYRGYDCGTVDGDFGNNTLKAVKAFQKAAGLTVDGIVGPATRKALI